MLFQTRPSHIKKFTYRHILKFQVTIQANPFFFLTIQSYPLNPSAAADKKVRSNHRSRRNGIASRCLPTRRRHSRNVF